VDNLIKSVSHDIDASDDKIVVPSDINSRVQKWITYFSVTDRERFRRYLVRGSYYKPLVEALFKHGGAPSDLYYLAMIESGYSTHAKSQAAAVGVWQFISSTGQRYGLEVNSSVDERRDPVRATLAAIRYLKDLHGVFNSWYLAMAAYNAGEGRIMNAIMAGRSHDFWTLAQKGWLPRETRDYVPKFIAAAIIGENPARYGFDNLPDEGSFPRLEGYRVPALASISEISQLTGFHPDDIRILNPHLLRERTPASPNGYTVWVPALPVKAPPVKEGQEPLPMLAQNALKMLEADVPSAPALTRANVVALASQMRTINYDLRGARPSFAPKKRRTRASARSVASLARRPASTLRRVAFRPRVKIYRVQRGENLTQISKRFSVPLHQLKRINNLSRNGQLFAGQKIAIPL
jgi:membrane-bound lytic murein transglycosylase D